jgi:hypothetical protein
MALAQEAAIVIAAGMVVGTFASASAGLLNRRSRRQVERDALRDGHIGALIVFGIWILDLCNV